MRKIQQDFKIIYYAHSKLIYNTAQEAEERQFLKDEFKGCLICPNNSMSNGNGSSEVYAKIISRVDVVVFSEFKGSISTGVHHDCVKALELGIPVYALRKNNTGAFNLYELESITIHPKRSDNCHFKAKVKNYSTQKLKTI